MYSSCVTLAKYFAACGTDCICESEVLQITHRPNRGREGGSTVVAEHATQFRESVMRRREFLGKAGLGSAAVATLASPPRAEAATVTAHQHEHGSAISGPQATATVSFGAWASGADRHPNLGGTATNQLNVHAVIPNEVQIKAGGTVNFIISGFHQVIVYGDGTAPENINASDTVPATVQPGPPLINDANNRVFRGIDPSVLPALQGPPQGSSQPVLQDRIEAVQFAEPGRYLVICGVLPHFLAGMYGYVKVNP
jgi:plastocyanin